MLGHAIAFEGGKAVAGHCALRVESASGGVESPGNTGQGAAFRDVRCSLPAASSGRLGGMAIYPTIRIAARQLRGGATRTLIVCSE